MTLLIGDTGAGKSTLFRILTNFNELEFLWRGQTRWYTNISFYLFINESPTSVVMFPKSKPSIHHAKFLYEELIFTLENLQIPADQIDGKIQHAIALGKVDHLLHRDFWPYLVEKKQQVSLAVLLAMDSQIILLDEPFASVDQGTQALDSSVSGFDKNGKTVILCDQHDRSLYADCVDHLVELKMANFLNEM